MQLMHPDFVVHAGDIEYYDKPKPWAWTVELMRFKWARLFSMPRNRTFYSQHTTYFIKDDHDTLKNDCWPGQEYGAVTFEEGVHLFNQSNFPPAIQDITPSDGARMWRSGCWKAEIIGVPIEWKMARKNRFSEVPKRLGCNLPLEPLRLPSSWCSRRPRSLGLIDPIRKTIMPMKCFLMRARSSGLCFPLWMVHPFLWRPSLAVCLGRSDDRVVGIWLRTRKCQTPVGMEGRRSKAPAPISARGRWVS